MIKQSLQLEEMKLIGITARTNNQDEMDHQKAKIGATAGQYWQQNLANQFEHRIAPGITYAVYTDFESDEHGDYTYFIGELVDSFEGQPDGIFKTLTIPASRYQRFTTPAGQMPQVVIAAWQAICAMQPSDFGGQRQYIADFEVYDQRASDPNQTIIDVYIGIE